MNESMNNQLYDLLTNNTGINTHVSKEQISDSHGMVTSSLLFLKEQRVLYREDLI